MQQRILTAFFPRRVEASGTLDRILALGVPAEDISIIPKHVRRLDDLGLTLRSKASEGAALGAVAGGALLAALAALAAGGALILPGVGAFLAGPLVAALAGAGAGGAAGLLLGALLGSRLPEYEARYLEDVIEMGGALVAVRCSAEAAAAIATALNEGGGLRVHRSRPRRIAMAASEE